MVPFYGLSIEPLYWHSRYFFFLGKLILDHTVFQQRLNFKIYFCTYKSTGLIYWISLHVFCFCVVFYVSSHLNMTIPLKFPRLPLYSHSCYPKVTQAAVLTFYSMFSALNSFVFQKANTKPRIWRFSFVKLVGEFVKFEKPLLASSQLFLPLSPWNNSALTWLICIKFDIGNFD